MKQFKHTQSHSGRIFSCVLDVIRHVKVYICHAAYSVTGSSALQLKYGQPNLQASNTESDFNLTSSSKHTHRATRLVPTIMQRVFVQLAAPFHIMKQQNAHTVSDSSGLWSSAASMLTSNCPQNRERERGKGGDYTEMSSTNNPQVENI